MYSTYICSTSRRKGEYLDDFVEAVELAVGGPGLGIDHSMLDRRSHFLDCREPRWRRCLHSHTC